ncbi:hypothetical protein KIMC2_06190 [Xylocopilactobacillus apis]|uniref:Chloride channel protein n=1 Tax=Xylocopilactobacillus apis TaxID=2932183 RepID=A0AAU9D5H0_9LACO|nr:hypothetical protein KIMC2_06190 [Xylocopilactobacillus apis]
MENKESEFRDHQEKLFLIANALIIGTLTGFVISVFRLAIEKIFDLITKIFTNFNQSPIPVLLLIIFSVLALSGCGFLIHRYPYLSGSGIPQIEGQLKGVYHEKAIGTLIGKFFGGIIAIGSGLMLGREGPSVQIGGSIGQITSSFYHQKEDRHLKIFIACGAAAGLSAAFTAPLASVIFVAEEIYHRFIPVVWISAFVSSMAASFVTLNIFGLQPVLKIHYISVLQLKYYPWIIIIGILIGLLCRLYQILLLKMPLLMSYTKLPDYFFGPFVYILMIPLALFLPYCIGGGNQLITFVGKNSINIWFLGLIILIRFLYSLLSYATKLPGEYFYRV